ncbi:hypothetical protein [Tenacibaculum maritimum]|uniref:hypothetical protein n=1 Tax=Tenacibaculum maritimum TaxID=107401 RepID=UPI0012E58B4E|nr:hypothetical protein [Tenacibaculum maritimum]MCD9585334.1 hypothetical protein [Tenacibaculum maritimum]MCD9621818.1 hypothetical protein [Tenacibaculum maritimum]MCD9628185.1 hypothetical protein [Tenacibaculum maritimum]MCD9633833.1 hypothetical protein [Tenacibaculum maritimum]CAA0227741.1 membrane hypothetical protein [Tenacibaculum maritimum]
MFYILIPILLVVLSLSYRAVDPFTESYKKADKNFQLAKKRNSISLTQLKNMSKGTMEYRDYIRVNKIKKEAFNKREKEIENQRVFSFDSKHYFLERFGRNVADIFISVFAFFLIIRYVPKKNNSLVYFGSQLIVVSYLSTKLFVTFWIFQKFEDYSLMQYLLVTLFSSLIILAVVFYLMRFSKREEENLLDVLMNLLKFTFKNTKPEKREEMLEMIKKIASHK